MDIIEEYNRWLNSIDDKELLKELKQMNKSQKSDSFYRDLVFGTGGLRGVLGAGTNRINVYVVAKASQGLANYVKKNYKNSSIAISYDSRIKSLEFAETAASVFAANGIKAYIYTELMPTPCLSYAVRYLKCSAGVMVTASHNPAKYNGYKVYNDDGCQITDKAANAILEEINKVDIFNDVKKIEFKDGLKQGLIQYIKDEVYDSFIKDVSSLSSLYGDEINKDISIVYTPLNGAGLKPVTRILKENGYTNIIVVKEQEQPNGNFPTCPYPNPEIKEAMELGIKYAKENNAELVLATDPDSDRVGIAVKDNNDYVLLTGNEVGLLLLDYICSQRIKHNKMPSNPYIVKTIVTTDLAEAIAKSYGVKVKNVLTGFKYIGEQIALDEDNYIFGFEESYGYLSGIHARDKDAVNGAFIIAEMFAFYKTRNISLVQKLNELYKKYGYCLNTLHSYEFPGEEGFNRMKQIMDFFRNGDVLIPKFAIKEKQDYSIGLNGLPKSDVVKFINDKGSIVLRPSGTEPKLKVYLSVTAGTKEEAIAIEKELSANVVALIYQ